MYTYRRNNEFVYPVNLTSRFNGIGAWNLKTDAERAEQEYYRLESVNDNPEPYQIRSTFADVVLDETCNICTATYVITDKSLIYYKNERIGEAKALRDTEANARPPVDTGLGFSVDGAVKDVNYFEIGKRLGKLFVVDSEGVSRVITLSDWDTILDAVSVYRLSILEKYWAFKTAIEACTTLSQIQNIDIE